MALLLLVFRMEDVMLVVKQVDDREPQSTGDEIPTLRCDPMKGERAASGSDRGASDVPSEADDRALEEAGYGHGV